MKRMYTLLLFAAASLALFSGGMVFGHDEDEEDHVAHQAPEGKPRSALSISSFVAPPQDQTRSEHSVVQASRFELTDAAGRTRAVLGFSADDEPNFALADRSGQIFAKLSIEPVPGDAEGIPVLQLIDKAGTVRTDIRLTRAGDPMVVLKNQRGGHVASVSGTALNRGGTEWLLSDDAGRVRAALTVNHAGTNLSLMDEAKKARARLSVTQDGTPKLVFLDDAGRQQTALGHEPSLSRAAPSPKNP